MRWLLSNAQIIFTLEGVSGSTVLLDNFSLVPGDVAHECTYVGDPIGSTAASTTGTGANPSMQGVQGSLEEDLYDWNSIVGATGFLYESDGKSLLKNFRSIVAVVHNGVAIGWDMFNWSITIFKESDF